MVQRNRKTKSKERPLRNDAKDASSRGRRARTLEALTAQAMRLAQSGRIGSVAEVAHAAGVSRATAYRYFPNHAALIDSVVEESLGPVRRFESAKRDGGERIRDVFDRTFPRFKEFEPHMRAALQLALEHWALERAGTLAEEPYRRGHRVKILDRAGAPLKRQLGARLYARLLRSLSVIYGIEPYVVLKDIWHASDAEVAAVSRWMLDAMLAAAQREAVAPVGRKRARR